MSEAVSTPSIVRPRRQLSRNSAMRYTFFKTELCRYYVPDEQGIRCEKGLGCPFAHGEHELRTRPDLTKTSLCQLFRKGKCRKGETCSFAHGAKELRTRETPQLLADLGPDIEDVETSKFCRSCSESSLPFGDSPASSLADEKTGRCAPKLSAYCPCCQRPGPNENSRFCPWCGIGLVEGKALSMAKAAAAAAAAAAPRSSHSSRRRLSRGRHGGGDAAKATVRAGSPCFRALSKQEVLGGSRLLEPPPLKPDATGMAQAQTLEGADPLGPCYKAPAAPVSCGGAEAAWPPCGCMSMQVAHMPQVSYVECVPVYMPVVMPFQFGIAFPVVNKSLYTEVYED